MICKFCKRPLVNKEEEYYEICDGCYYGMRLDPGNWLRWLRKIGEDAVRVKIGLFVPKEEWYEGIDEDRINKLAEHIKEDLGNGNKRD